MTPGIATQHSSAVLFAVIPISAFKGFRYITPLTFRGSPTARWPGQPVRSGRTRIRREEEQTGKVYPERVKGELISTASQASWHMLELSRSPEMPSSVTWQGAACPGPFLKLSTLPPHLRSPLGKTKATVEGGATGRRFVSLWDNAKLGGPHDGGLWLVVISRQLLGRQSLRLDSEDLARGALANRTLGSAGCLVL